MKVLITGGAGFIGSHLAEAHIARGDEVIALDDLSTGRLENVAGLKNNPRFRLIVGSVIDREAVRVAISGVDRIYHLAAAVGVKYVIDNPLHSLHVNLMGTEVILESANHTKIPVFLASTSEIYGKNEKIPFAEDDDRVMGSTRVTRWGYANSKATDEFIAFAYNREEKLPLVIGRFFNTVGPRQRGRYGMVIPRFVKAALAGEDIQVYGTGDQTRCFLDVADAVSFMMALCDRPECIGNVYNIGSTERISIHDLARKIVAITGSRSKIVFKSYEEAFQEGFEDMLHRVPDMTRFRATTGLNPRHDLESTIKRVVENYKR